MPSSRLISRAAKRPNQPKGSNICATGGVRRSRRTFLSFPRRPMPIPAERPDIAVIERVLADRRMRESVGASLSHRSEEFAIVFQSAFDRFFEARIERQEFPQMSNEERLVVATYAKLAYGFRFRIDSRFMREPHGRACLRDVFERIRAKRRFRPIITSTLAERAAECRRRFSLDSLFENPFREIGRGSPFDLADILLLTERGDDCTPLFFVDQSGHPLRLETAARENRTAIFAPLATFADRETFSLLEVSGDAFDNITVNGSIAKLDLSPRPGYYYRETISEPGHEARLSSGFEVRAIGSVSREDDIVRAEISRLRSERIFETRFRRLVADRHAAFLVASPYDVRIRGALHAFDRVFPDSASFRRAIRAGDGSVFDLARSIVMTFPWHIRSSWRASMPILAAATW
jgi:hypothetical protein